MGDIFGADFLTNPKMAEAQTVDLKLPELDLPTVSFEDSQPLEPKLMPNLDSVGPMHTSEGLNNYNAEPFFGSSSKRMSEENLMKEKYEILRKFERLAKLGVPMRKRFTIDSPIDEMKLELEFIKREKAMDQTIKQFCDWFITGMSALEWSSKNVPLVQAFGLQLSGLSESAQMNVADMEDDFEELYDLYGDKMKMHPLVRIPIRTCMMVYMVHLTNQMAAKAPVPNMDQILRTNPDIARQLATAAMQQQSHGMRGSASASMPVMAPPPQQSNPLSGISNFMSSMMPPPPPPVQMKSVKPAIKYPKPQPAVNIPPPPPAKEMSAPIDIDELLRSVNSNVETKSVNTKPSSVNKKGGSTGKNSVSIKL
jgi:hypothetical protein